MRILSIAASLKKRHGGSTRATIELSTLLDSNFDHELLLIGQNETQYSPHMQFKNLFGNDYGIPEIRFIKEMKKMKEYELIILHGFYLFTTLIALVLVKRRIWIILHGGLDDKDTNRLAKRMFNYIFRIIARNRDVCLIATSFQEMQFASNAFPELDSLELPLGILMFQENCDNMNAHSISNPKRTGIVSISRITKKKRLDLVIESFSLLMNKFPHLELIIAGEGEKEYLNTLKKLVRKYDLDDKVKFIDWVDESEKIQLYQSASLFVLPSESENFGYAVAESIINGLPVVVSNKVAIAKTVQENDFGVVIDNLDAHSLAEAISMALLSINALQFGCLKNRYILSWDTQFLKWKAAIQENSSNL
jgi:glycosyltransferase involved in cell wall biosynthesis